MSGQPSGQIPYYSNNSPVAPYNLAVGPGAATYANFSTTYANPQFVNPNYPVNQGDPQKSITQNIEARSVYQYYTTANSSIAGVNNGTPYKSFGSFREMYAFQQGMNAAGAQAKPFYNFLNK